MKQLAQLQLVNVDRFELLKNQLLFFIGSVPIILVGLYALIAYKPFERYKVFSGRSFLHLAFSCGLRQKIIMP